MSSAKIKARRSNSALVIGTGKAGEVQLCMTVNEVYREVEFRHTALAGLRSEGSLAFVPFGAAGRQVGSD